MNITGIDFPILILRKSGLIIRREYASKIAKMNLTTADLFKSADIIKSEWVKKTQRKQLVANTRNGAELSAVFERIKLRAYKIDATLAPAAEGIQARLKDGIDNLEKKLIKAEKANYHTRLDQVETIKADLFPKGGLQERTENFGLFYVKWGQDFIDELIRNFQPLDFTFTVLKEQ